MHQEHVLSARAAEPAGADTSAPFVWKGKNIHNTAQHRYGVFQAGSEASRKETAFALRYTAEEADIIPDFVPDIGYADDSVIVRTVLDRHQFPFREYCKFRKIRWSNNYLAP